MGKNPAQFDPVMNPSVIANLLTGSTNRYSVPCHLANHKVAIHLYPDRIEVSVENAIVACHTRLLDRDQVSYDWQHYIPVIQKKPGALRNGAPFADMAACYTELQSQGASGATASLDSSTWLLRHLLEAESNDRGIR